MAKLGQHIRSETWESDLGIHDRTTCFIGTKLYLVERLAWDQEVEGSNPSVPTISSKNHQGGEDNARVTSEHFKWA